MARKPRIHYPGALYHVTLRGNARQEIFFDNEVRCRFYLLLQDMLTLGTWRTGLTNMLDDLMQIIQVENGELPLETERISLYEFLPKLVRRIAVSEIGERLHTVLSSDLPEVWVNTGYLERILANLLTNAFKYSAPDSSVTLVAEDGSGEIFLSVIDRGKGIAPEDLPHLFDRFFRGRDVGKKPGIGLGLYITKKLVEAQSGRVWGKSQPGKVAYCAIRFIWTPNPVLTGHPSERIPTCPSVEV